MYLTHFGLRHRPFRSGPDPESYYPATGHELAMANLRDGLAEDEGVLLLIGMPGTGKTLLAQRLADSPPADTRCVFVTHSRLDTRLDLLQMIAYDLELPNEGKSEHALRIAIIENCVARFQNDERTLFLFDEAHHLGIDLLEELRLLSNLEGHQGKVVQIVLVGLPRLLETLQKVELEALQQRIGVTALLMPLDPNESADYILHQLRAAGGRPERIFAPEALELLTGQGIPRVLNQLGHACLKIAAQNELKQVDAEVAIEVIERRVPTEFTIHHGQNGRSGLSSDTKSDETSSRLLIYGDVQTPVA